MKHKREIGIILIIGGCISLFVDIPVLIQYVPWYYWPLIAICPLYPTLLGFSLVMKPSGSLFLSAIGALGTVGSITYGILALPYYLLTPINLVTIGNLVWVATYGIIGWLSLEKKNSRCSSWLFSILFVASSITAQYLSNSFSYLSLEVLSQATRVGLLILGYGILAILYRRTIVR